MGYVSARDGAQILYEDWGSGPPVVLSHGWPLNGDRWEAQQLLISGAEPETYRGAPHGISDTHKAQLSEDLLAFVTRVNGGNQ